MRNHDGDVSHSGPQYFLTDTGGGNIEFLHSIAKVPSPTEEPTLPAGPPFRSTKHPFVTAVGNREDVASSSYKEE